MSNVRQELLDIVSGWLLVDDFAVVTDFIEASAAWVKANGGIDACSENERTLIQLMIKRQIALAEQEGISLFAPPEGR